MARDKKRKYHWIGVVLVLGVVLANIKNVFTNFDIDAEYAIAMSWRMVKGDQMFMQMREPHQTSAFLSAFFIWIYYAFVETTTGIVVYLNAVGLLIKGGVVYFLYRTFRKHLDARLLFFMCLFSFAVNPKDILLPEFSNMQLWFSILLFCSLFRYFQEQQKKGWLLLSGGFLCLEILSYPSCLIVYLAVMLLLFLYADKKWKDMVILSGECMILGSMYLTYFITRYEITDFMECIGEILSGDASHESTLGKKLITYAGDLGQMLMLIAVFILLSVAVAYAYSVLYYHKKEKKATNDRKMKWFMGCFFSLFFVQNFISALVVKGRYWHLVVYIPILLFAWVMRKRCDKAEKQAYVIGTMISLCSFIATLMLTNLTLFTSMAYLVLGIMVALIPFSKMMEKQFSYVVIGVFCFVTVFRTGYIIKPMNEYHASILDIEGVVKSGPALGIVSNYMGPYIINSSMEEWEQYIEPGDKILLVGEEAVSTIGYLYGDTEICADSTICTPTYDEKLLRYWERNPEKYPNVVIVDCWYGELNVSEDSWIMQWIENEFQPDETVDGKYWRYYIKKNTH